MKKILLAFGTRPEWLKIQPVVQELELRNVPFQLLFTGQHKDILPNIDYTIHYSFDDIVETCDERLSNITISVLQQLEDVLWDDIKTVVVQGDTTSAFAVALGAFYRGKPIAHIESGLRTKSIKDPFPEEFNRRTIDSISKYLFCPTQYTYEQMLIKYSGKDDKVILHTGNTIIDTLPNFKPEYQDFVLLTLHRRENWSNIISLLHIISSLSTYKTVYILHPSVKDKLRDEYFDNMEIIEPVDHFNFCQLLSKCRYVITDSGGVQEEATFYKKKIILCREDTERSESESISSIIGNANNIDIYKMQNAISEVEASPYFDLGCPFGDGIASVRIVDALLEL